MAKSVIVSHFVASQIARCNAEDEFQYGLVLGQTAGDKLMVIHLARTPTEEAENDEGEVEPVEVTKLNEVEAEWLGEHVKQVGAMLPGGMNVCGIFVASHEDVLSSKAKIGICLKAIGKRVPELTSLVVFHLNLEFHHVKIELHSSVEDSKPGKSIPYEEADLKWLCLKANVILDQPLAFTQEQSERPLKQKLDTATKRLERTIENSIMLINSQHRNDSELLDPSEVAVKRPKEKGNKRGHWEELSTTTEASGDEFEGGHRRRKSKEYEVDILFDDSESTLEDCVVADISAKMRIIGRMSARAFVHSKATVGEAIKALKADIMRTFKARLDMHCDSLVGEEMRGTDNELPILHEPPRRVNIRLPDCSITVSDFLFPGEAPEESVKAVEEMLGFTPNFEHLDDELEIIASPQVARMEEDSESRAESPILEKKAAQSQCSPLQILLSVVIVLLAIAASYWLTTGEEIANEELPLNVGPADFEEMDDPPTTL